MKKYLHSLLPEEQDKIVLQYIKYIKQGIPKTKEPKKVLIIGAGIAGIVSAIMLKDAGHDVTIVEANTRIGGRCKTFLNEKNKKYWADENLTAEAGAMRLPSFHYMLMAYLDKYQIDKIRFYNASVSKKGNQKFVEKGIEPPHTEKTFLYANYNQVRLKAYHKSTDINQLLEYHLEVNKNPASTNPDENQPAAVLLDNAVAPLREFIKINPEQNWPVVIQRFGEYSMRRFLKEQTSYSENALEMIGVLQNLESRMSYDFIQSFIEMANISPKNEYWQIVGGTYILPKTLVEENDLDNPEIMHLGQVVTAIYLKNDKVRISTRKEQETLHQGQNKARKLDEMEFDEAIVTMPFTALRQVHIWPKFTQEKRKAIRELHYDAATKVLLEFTEGWWEKTPYKIIGGGSVTDMSNRFIYYPSQNINKKGNRVLLAVYCWADDARKWDSMTHQDRYTYALDNVAIVHAGDNLKERQRIKDLCVFKPNISSKEIAKNKEKGYVDGIKGAATVSWMQNNYALGEAAIFYPGQLDLLHDAICDPEWDGKLHIAGEHASLKHAWIEGAIESAIRSALAVNETVVE